jgi:hypothetical protein
MDPQLKSLQEEIASAVAGLSAEQWDRHPPGKWCAGEVLEHLYLTYTGTAKGFSRVMEAGKLSVTPASWRQRGRKLVVVGLGYLPSGREAPAMARPKGLPRDKVRAEIAGQIAEMYKLIGRCEEKFGSGKQLLDHPILGPLTGVQWRKFHLVHGRHHLKQIRALRVVGF